MDLDDLPAVASGTGTGIPNDPDAAPAEPNFDDLPFEELLSGTNWKAHKAAYDRIVNAGNDVDLNAFSAGIVKLSKDVGGPAGDSFAEAVATLLEGGGLDPAHAASVVLTPLVEKALIGRPRGCAAAVRALHSLTCAQQNEAVFAALCKAMAAKAPKLRCASITTLSGIIEQLGMEHFSPRPLIKAIVPLFNDTDARVRKEAMGAIVHCYRYIGPAIQQFLVDLRDVQKQELDKLFADAQPASSKPSTSRPAESAKPRRSSSRSQSPPQDYADALDNFDDEPETAVLGRLPTDFFTFTRDKSEPWKQRSQRITNELLPLLSTRRITANCDYTDVVKAIKEYMNDPQLPIWQSGFKCAQAITRSLRVGLAPYARFLIPTLFDKFKEKKPMAIEACSVTLDLMLRYKSVTPDQLHDEFEATCNSKLPNHRQAALNWATTAVATSPDPASFTRLSSANGLLSKVINDDKVEVREAASQLAVTIFATCGGARLASFINNLDDKQYARVTGSDRAGAGAPAPLDSAALSQSSRPTAARSAPASTVAARGTAGALGRVNSNSNMGATKTPLASSGTLARKQSLVGKPSSSAAAPAASNSASGTAAMILDEELFASTRVSAQDGARALIEHLSPIDPAVAAAVEGDLAAKEWRVRTDAATTIGNAAMQMPNEAAGVCAAAFVAVLRKATDWKEAMFQVANANARTLTAFIQAADSITPWTAFVTVQGFVARLSEPKSRVVVAELFTALTEQVGPKLVVRLVTAVAGEAKNPKLTAEVLEWTELTVQEFATPIDARALIDFVRGHVFEQPNPAVKTAGIRVCVALRRRLGARFDTMLGDINAHIRKSYEAEIAKDDDTDRPAVTQRRVRNAVDLPTSGPRQASAKPAGTTSVPATDVCADMPPEDISGALAAAIKQLADPKDWKLRAAGLRTIEDAVNGASRVITSAGVTDTFKALKARLEEFNKNFVVDVLRTMVLLADVVMPSTGARGGLRSVFPSTVLMLGDQKTALREEAIKVSNRAVMLVGLEPLCTFVVKAMASDNQSSRIATAEMVLSAFRAGHHTSFAPRAMTPLVQPLLKMFVDRNTTIRGVAEAAFSYVLSNVGFDVVARAVTSFKPADQKVIGPVLDRVRPIDEPAPMAATSQRLERTAVPAAAAAAAPSMQPQYAEADQDDRVMDAPATRPNMMPPPQPRHADPMSAAPPQAPPEFHDLPMRPRTGVTPADVAAGFRGAHTRAVPQLCADLNSIIAMDVLAVDLRTLDALVGRLQSVFDTDLVDEHLAAADALLHTLCGLVADERFAMHLTRESLERVLGTLFHCITAASAPAAPGPLRAVNQCVDYIVRGATPDTVIEAVFGLAMDLQQRDLIEANELSAKLADLPFRVIIRFGKFDRTTSPDAMVRATHGFLTRFPPSRLQGRTDRPIRVVKQILNEMRTRFGGERCMATCEAHIGRNNLVFGYLQMMEQQGKEQRAEQQQQQQQQHASGASPSAGSTHALERSDAVARHSTAVGSRAAARNLVGPTGTYSDALSSMTPNVTAKRPEASSVSLIFAKARKSETSHSALKELYRYIRENPGCPEFENQLARCSDAFKGYIRSHLSSFATDDGIEPPC